MINILKPGDPEKLKNTKVFKCRKCDCIFEADMEDYRESEELRNVAYYCDCPECGDLGFQRPTKIIHTLLNATVLGEK